MHDIVVLIEIKTSKLPHVPGFIPIMAKTVNSRRGGLAVLVKSALYSDICYVDTSVCDQVWFSLRSVPLVRFCGVYVTPSSSPYYNDLDIANIQAKTIDQNMNYFIIGDMNARLGPKIDDLVTHNRNIRYRDQIDPTVNDNGRKLLSVCKDNKLIILNNLEYQMKHFCGALTFRLRNKLSLIHI